MYSCSKLSKFILWFLVFTLFSVVSVSAVVTDEDLRNNSQSYWTQDNDFVTSTNTIDSTENNNGTIIGSPSSITGIINQALDFDGSNDGIDIASNGKYDFSEGFMFSAWIYYEGSFSGKENLIYFRDAADHELVDFQSRIESDGNLHNYWVSDSGGTVGTSFSVTPNTWTAVFVTYNPSNNEYTVYKNNQTIATKIVDDDSSNSNSEESIGYKSNGNERHFPGRIDEVGIWGEYKNSEEISAIYNRQSQNLSGAQYPFEPAVLSFQNITVNNEEIINDTVYNISKLNFSVDVLNTSTNGDVNQTYNLFYNNGTQINSSQYATNNVNGSFSINLSNGRYKINFFAENNETSVQSQNYSIRIDIDPPELIVSIPNEINTYDLNLTEEINFSATGLASIDTCQVTFNYSFNSSQQITPCQNETFNFDYNGNWTYDIFVNDTAGNSNTDNGSIFVDPQFFRYFNNNTADLQNFSINGTEYQNFFNSTVYSEGLGVKTYNFQKTGYEELNFTINLTRDFSALNETIFLEKVFININLFDAADGSPAPNNNYTIFLSEVDTDNVETYTLNNDNSLTIQNNYARDTNISIRLTANESLSSTLQLITTRQNVTIPIYLTFEQTSPRIIEVLTSSLIAIPDNDVTLFRYIEGEGFVLETIKETNVLGQVAFNIVEDTATYNICSTYLGNQKCLTNIAFENEVTDPFQIVHDSNLSSNEIRVLEFITYSSDVNRTTNDSALITFTFEDKQSLTDRFCMNVTRFTNDSGFYLGEFCNNNPQGQVVQNFSLGENQYLDVTLFFESLNQTFTLTTFKVYGENALLTELKKVDIIDALFLILYFSLIAVLIKTNNLTLYNIGFLGGLMVILAIQAYVQKEYVTSVIWSFLFFKSIVLYFVRVKQ